MTSESNSIPLALKALVAGNCQEAATVLATIDHFNSETVDNLFIKGDRYYHQAKYPESIVIFEQLYRVTDPDNFRYFDIQRALIKAYQQDSQNEKAIALCQQLIASDIESNRIWGERFLLNLAPNLAQELITRSTTVEAIAAPEIIDDVGIKLQTLAKFKQYCQDNLLTHLKQYERKRKQALLTIIISGIMVFWVTWLILKLLFSVIGVVVYSFLLPFISIGWIYFCRSCVQVYGLNFKRNIIENIVKFIDPRLQYANQLFLEDKRQTIIAFTQSQLFRNNHQEPDSLEQEDCVYGKIGNTNIFFAEILAEKLKANYNDISGLTVEENRNRQRIFRGLFFEAKFAKNFKGRAFVLPNDLKSKAPLINSWRGELVKLEDPEFNRIFRVYGDNQIETRYILSTNLIDRLVNFHQKAKRKVYISFIQGFVYIAIRYDRDLFEPKLWQSMLSFAPLKEYYQNLQLMIGIVEDLKLNRRIWQ